MKNVFILMLGLVAGTASFANTTGVKTPETAVGVTNDQNLKLIVGHEDATATITLTDDKGHVLYVNHVNLHDGLQQKFNIAELNGGSYKLVVAVGDDAVVKTFVIKDQPAQKVVAFRS